MFKKRVEYSDHALGQMAERGATQQEVEETLLKGEKLPAKRGRDGYRLNFQYDAIWAGKRYRIKQVMPIVKEEPLRTAVITVYVFYF